MADETQKQQLAEIRRWYEVSFNQIQDYILDNFSVLDLDSVQCRLLSELSDCKAASPAQFREWARTRIADYANDDRLFDFARVRTIQDVLDLAACRPVDSATKPMQYESNGDRISIQLQDAEGKNYTWKIPTDWLKVAAALWPCHVRFTPQRKPYVNRKGKRKLHNGTWQQVDQPVHRIFVNAPNGAVVDALDGDYLNYVGGNLRVHELAASTKQAKEAPLGETLSLPDPWFGAATVVTARSTRVRSDD